MSDTFDETDEMLSLQFLSSAFERLSHIVERGDDRGRPRVDNHYDYDAVHVVVLSAIALETGINEAAGWVQYHPTAAKALPAKLLREQIRPKVQLLLTAVGAPKFDEDAHPFVDFSALVDLRNAIVHGRQYAQAPNKAMERLRLLNHTGDNSDWFLAAMTLRTARWSIGTLRALLVELGARLHPHVPPIGPSYWWPWHPGDAAMEMAQRLSVCD